MFLIAEKKWNNGARMKKKKYKCKCCNYYTLDEYPFEICPVCLWEDCGIEELDVYDGVNQGYTLRQGKENYQKYSVSKPQFYQCVREPFISETVSSAEEYTTIEFDWPDIETIFKVLQDGLEEKRYILEISLWAEDILDNKFIAEQIEGYYPIDEIIEVILEKMVLLGDEESEKNMTEDDQQLILEILKELEEVTNGNRNLGVKGRNEYKKSTS